ncbi:PC4 domain-containing protein [Trichonephila inaurata madagascariensis]|uniref:PC4 domain-containing protein n=1 Tax=Trichonephila inaurata madagascariensis TaxID=2747483 RepID=A0A8X6XTU7_9ARAC|nr:PC4 domain-containing protein [Trichonephila inaurata madagascariensis]
MPRSSSKVFKKRRGNFKKGRRSNSESTATSDSVPQQSSASNSNISASEKKLSNLNNSYKSEFNSGFKNAIVDLNVLAGVFSEAVKCLQCGATGLNLSCEENCSGGAVELDILCDFCSYSYKFCSSKKCKAEIGKPSIYEINTRCRISTITTSLIELFYEYLGSSITDVFECFGCIQGYANQLGHECITMDSETRLQLFGDLAFFAMNFEQLIQDFIQRNIQMLNYISPIFVNNWDMTSVINNAKSMYIASDIHRLP